MASRTRFLKTAVAGLAALALAPSAFCAGVWFPSSKELFRPLLADPKEPGYQLRWTSPNGAHSVTEIGIGDLMGIYRAPLAAGGDWQAGVAGGVIGRFDTAVASNYFETADFTFALPFDFRKGPGSLRLAYWHVSSHLGDDFIRISPGISISKHFTDETLALGSYDLSPRWRLYGGLARAFKVLPSVDKYRAQAGAEYRGPALWSRGAEPVAGLDLQALQRNDWKAAVNVLAGLRFSGASGSGAATFFAAYYQGPLYYQYRYAERETHWTFGVRLEMGSPAPGPAR